MIYKLCTQTFDAILNHNSKFLEVFSLIDQYDYQIKISILYDDIKYRKPTSALMCWMIMEKLTEKLINLTHNIQLGY